MKKITIFIILLSYGITSGQSQIATTEKGQKVLLKTNNTWEYLDSPSNEKKLGSERSCNVSGDFVEPKSEKGVNAWLKKFDATTDDLKSHVAVENDCNIEDVKLLKISEQKGNGMYSLCVKGIEMKYRRMGSVFSKANENAFDNGK